RKDPAFADYFVSHECKTPSILDTLSFRIPYVLLPMLGRGSDRHDFQFNKLLVGYTGHQFEEYPKFVQAQVLPLTSLLYQPLIDTLPFATRLNSRVFFLLKSAIGVLTYYLPDVARPGNGVRLVEEKGHPLGDVAVIEYRNSKRQLALYREILRATKKAL